MSSLTHFVANVGALFAAVLFAGKSKYCEGRAREVGVDE